MALALVICLIMTLFTPLAQASLVCEYLPQDMCAFAVSSTCKRCILESIEQNDGQIEFKCKTSNRMAIGQQLSDWIESDECVSACGLDRDTVGFDSDSIGDEHFVQKICSPACYKNCHNIIDLYSQLADEKGVILPNFCTEHVFNLRRIIAELSPAPSPF